MKSNNIFVQNLLNIDTETILQGQLTAFTKYECNDIQVNTSPFCNVAFKTK